MSDKMMCPWCDWVEPVDRWGQPYEEDSESIAYCPECGENLEEEI